MKGNCDSKAALLEIRIPSRKFCSVIWKSKLLKRYLDWKGKATTAPNLTLHKCQFYGYLNVSMFQYLNVYRWLEPLLICPHKFHLKWRDWLFKTMWYLKSICELKGVLSAISENGAGLLFWGILGFGKRQYVSSLFILL